MMRLDLNLIEIFCCVYEESNITKAAGRLRISQPTVSCHIKNLESYVGAKLFDRLPRRLIPTHAGKLLYRRGFSILKEKEAAMQDLEKFLRRIEGSLRISGGNILGEYVLPQLIAGFYAQFPAVKVELKISEPKVVCEDVLSGDAELGFTCLKIDTIGLEYRPFATGEMALVVPNTKVWRRIKAMSLEQLAVEPFLSRETGSGMRALVEEKIGRTLEDFNVVGVFGSDGGVKEALKAGMGISIMSLFSVKHELASGELKVMKIKGIDIQAPDLFVATNKRLTLSPIAETFLASILETQSFSELALKASA